MAGDSRGHGGVAADRGGPRGDGSGGARGNLLIGRFKGEGIYIGRDLRVTMTAVAANGITIRIESPPGVVVTDTDLGMGDHLLAVEKEERRFGTGNPNASRVGREFILLTGAGLYVGRGVEITLAERVELPDGRVKAQIAIEAPQWMAVSRDDFTFEQHMRYQVERERRNRR